MDNTFLMLITLIVDLTNQLRAAQQEVAVLKSGLPVEEAK